MRYTGSDPKYIMRELNMKRSLLFLNVVILVLCLAACNSYRNKEDSTISGDAGTSGLKSSESLEVINPKQDDENKTVKV